MVNIFDDDSQSFFLVRNSMGQYALWPARLPVPDGWPASYGPAGRAECLRRVADVAGEAVSAP